MSILGMFTTDINKGIEDYKSTESAILLDVRTKEEFSEGHIPGSINIPAGEIETVEETIPDHDIPVFVYCLRGSRSRKAVSKMKLLGYKNVKSIGGITGYKGLKVV